MNLSRIKIVRTAKCQKVDNIFEVRSREYERLLGAAETEGEAWQLFFELLDDVVDAYKEGSLVGYERAAAQTLGRKGGIVSSARKAKSSAANGRKGGRPKGSKNRKPLEMTAASTQRTRSTK